MMTSYVSPPWEYSLVKGVPIGLYSREFMKTLVVVHGSPLRVKFRGPRAGDGRTRNQQQATCLRSAATTFAVYNR